ncbi:hypothetical protein [Waltera sp.]|uniref:hypothetical protein n=1 Tax=Waltera sp. TaxID=2815806 RepID=UPI0039A130CF
MYIGNQTYIPVNNDVVKITMDSMFPWEGNIKVKVQGVKEKVRLHFRIPSYARKFPVILRWQGAGTDSEARAMRVWEICRDSELSIQFDMPVEFLHADPRVSADVGKVAIKRGPIVYCLEEVDNGAELQCIYLSGKAAQKKNPLIFQNALSWNCKAGD